MVRLIFRINIKYKQKNISCYSGYPDEMQLATNLSKRGFHLRWGSRFLYWEIWKIWKFEDLKDLKIWKIWGIWRFEEFRVYRPEICLQKSKQKTGLWDPSPFGYFPFKKGRSSRNGGVPGSEMSLIVWKDLKIWGFEELRVTV